MQRPELSGGPACAELSGRLPYTGAFRLETADDRHGGAADPPRQRGTADRGPDCGRTPPSCACEMDPRSRGPGSDFYLQSRADRPAARDSDVDATQAR